MSCQVDGHEIEIITIEDILSKIERSVANLTEEQKTVMKAKLLQYEYDKLSDFLDCLPKIKIRLVRLRNDISKELEKLNVDK